MGVAKAKPEQSGLGHLIGLGEMVGGAVTGNPAMMAGGFSQMSDSPLGKAAGLYSTVSSLGGGGGKGAPTANDGNGKYNLGVDTTMPGANPGDAGNTAIQRALSAGGATPSAQIDSGLQALKDNAHLFPDQDHYMSIAESLLRAKHYGVGGGLNSGSGNDSGGMNG